MAKVQQISEMTPSFEFTEYDFFKDYEESFKKSELGRIHSILPLREMAVRFGLTDSHPLLDDYRFRDAIWCNLDYTTYSIRDYDYYFTPDLSLWVDLPTDFCNKENIYRTRFVGAYWQLCGYKVIPTASWGNADSFKYCYEGLPENSIIAVGGMGHHHCRAAESLWHYALQELERQKHPTLILIYGDEEDLSFLSTPVKFIPCQRL